MTSTTVKPYNQAIDILRIISILAVILIHTTTRSLEASGFDLAKSSWTLFLNQTSRFAIPLFFMISGFALELNFSFHFNYLSYLKKRFGRIFVPYLLWSIIYYFLIYTQHGGGFFSALLTGSASYQLYFIPSLLIFYLIFPLVHRCYRIIANKWTLLVLGIIQMWLLYLDYYKHSISFFYPISVSLFNYYAFNLGMIASRNQNYVLDMIKKWKVLIIPFTLALGFWVYWEGKNNYLASHNYLAFYSQWRPSILIYTILLASFLYYLFNKSKSRFAIIKTLSKLSFFVFFVHVIVLESLWRFGHWPDLSFFVLTASISFLAAYLVHKVPYLSKITG